MKTAFIICQESEAWDNPTNPYPKIEGLLIPQMFIGIIKQRKTIKVYSYTTVLPDGQPQTIAFTVFVLLGIWKAENWDG